MKRKAINTHYNTIRIQMFTVCTTPPPVKRLGAVQRLKSAKSNIYARRVAGLFFCLASVEGAGLLFCPAAMQPHTSVYSGFCIIHATIPPTLQNSAQGFAGSFPSICRVLPLPCVGCIQLYRTACATLERLPTPGRFAPIPDTNAAPGQSSGRGVAGGAEPLAATAVSLFGLSPDS